MKDTFSRISAFSTVLFNTTLGLLFCIFAISYFFPGDPAVSNMRILWMSPNNDFKSMLFEPNIDLTPQFTFNTKQIFVYLTLRTAEKEEMVWSRIVKNGENYRLFGTERSNYIFSGTSGPYVFELRGNIFPYVGQMKDVSYGEFRGK